MGNIPVADLPQKPANSQLPATNPLAGSYYLTPFLNYGIQYAQPNFNNPQVGFLVRQLHIRQALQYTVDQAGIDKAIWRGYASPTSGAIPTVLANQFTPAIENANGGLGPYPFSLAKARALLTSHGWSEVGGIMTCQGGTAAAVHLRTGPEPLRNHRGQHQAAQRRVQRDVRHTPRVLVLHQVASEPAGCCPVLLRGTAAGFTLSEQAALPGSRFLRPGR